MKKKTISWLKSKLDSAFSLRVRERDKFTCQRCGKVHKQVHCAHIFSRNKLSVRYEMDNAITLCYYCHIIWAHREPMEFSEWIQKRLGKEKVNKIKKLSQKIISDPRVFLEKLYHEIILSDM